MRRFLVRGTDTFAGFKAAGVYYGFGDEWLRVAGVKFAADGSASERTMRMSTPYVGTNDYGILTMTQQEIDEAVEDAWRHNFRVAIHANGDVTIDMVLKAYERVQKQWPRPDPRNRIEHCSLVNPDLLPASRRPASCPTPFWTYAHYHGEKWKEYGDEKMNWMFAHKSFLDYGIRVPGASDYGPGPFEPLMALQSMVTRKDFSGNVWGPKQRVIARRGADHRHAQRRLRLARGGRQGLDHRGQVRRLRHAGKGSARGEPGRDQEHPGGPDRRRRQDDVPER